MKATKSEKVAKKPKKTKKKRLESLAKIRRRLMRLWTTKVHTLHDGKCAICGKVHGVIDPATGRPSYMNAHHIEPRATCARLRYDVMNGILLCPSCHKFGRNSAHKGAVWFVTWLQNNRRAQYEYVLKNRDEAVNINDRQYLASVEAKLNEPIAQEEKELFSYKSDKSCKLGKEETK